ncbi:hypothetical protein OOJ91_12635 [Micromonospora lupini]|uniref:hypothetical protein n=1 Tax=Micromonospora lupini TaxID=285679 RepID=UPI00224F18C3|nr:hypothetical protein [Micromonospora lupini]MCX5066727.1 hypothetical protein [Micromonospora lupini]
MTTAEHDDDLQNAGQNLADGFAEFDATFLARLTPELRAVQLDARRRLYEHIDAVWERPKHAGVHPVDMGGYGAVAGLRDLLENLVGHVEQAQEVAGDDPDSFRVKLSIEPVE